jgi:hypothetical protein
MTSSGLAELDFIEELRLRRWAREHYVPPEDRSATWHPIVLQEMAAKDRDLGDGASVPAFAWTKS